LVAVGENGAAGTASLPAQEGGSKHLLMQRLSASSDMSHIGMLFRGALWRSFLLHGKSARKAAGPRKMRVARALQIYNGQGY